ncbi:MAG: hypothetical protein JW990_01925, partial [Thermoleophilia bacterium]|nr:hypothetical protein [Thermoleophilia bacterium]
MANSYSNARTALEKVLGRAFTEYQWELLVSQGYEAAILSRQRTPEEVAQELSELVAVLGGAGEKGERPTRTPEPRNWEEMEKVI